MSDSFVTLWIVARQAPLSMGFSRQESWSGLLLPSPGAIPDPGIKHESLTLRTDFFLPLSHQGSLYGDEKSQLQDLQSYAWHEEDIEQMSALSLSA